MSGKQLSDKLYVIKKKCVYLNLLLKKHINNAPTPRRADKKHTKLINFPDKMTSKNVRQSNIELLRITLMLMIIGHHMIVHGFGLKTITNPSYTVDKSTYIEILADSFLLIGVNCFVFISGFFGIKFQLRRVVSIVIQAFSYSVLFYFLSIGVGKFNFAWDSFARSLFPLSNNLWWFITTYLGLYFIAPLLNEGLKTMQKKQLAYILVGLFLINSVSSFIYGGISTNGYDIFSFIFLYVAGMYIHRFGLKIKNPAAVVVVCTLLLGAIGILLAAMGKHKLVWHLFYYNNPLIVLSAVSLFFVFYNLRLGYNKYINYIAPTMLGVYMIHDYPKIRAFISGIVQMLNKYFDHHPLALVSSLFILAIIILLVCSIVEMIRAAIYKRTIERWYESAPIKHARSKISTSASLHLAKWFS